MRSIILIILAGLACVFGQNPSQSTLLFEGTNELFPNPERGFSTYRSTAITESLIRSLRYSNITIVQRIYTIPSQFRVDSLSRDYLDMVEKDFNETRKGGAKIVIRFSYTENQIGADAPLNIVLKHISQLKPLFQKHADIIAYIEAGFIGAWGEWYYSSNGLNNTADRKTVLFALLDALPKSRSVVVRTPNYKKSIFGDADPISLEEAFSGTNKSRTGAHNDCFLASETDYGTYGNIEVDKTYLSVDNQFVPQGGETCNPSAYSDCGHAIPDLDRMHWSILNRDYHQTVLNGWETNGCMDEVRLRLG